MPAKTQDQPSSRRRRRHLRQMASTIVPTAVWFLAIVAAWQIYSRLGASTTLTGYAQDERVTLAHLEGGVVRNVRVQLFEQVARGQVLMDMDDKEERIQLAAIEKDVERLRTEVTAERARVMADNARAGADVVDLARRFAVDRETAHIEYLSQLALDARDRILLRGALVEYEIVQSLYERKMAPFRELNDLETEADSIRATVEKSAVVIARAKKAFEESDRRWIRFLEQDEVILPYEPVLTPLRLAIDVRERDLEEIVRRIDTHVLRSPIDGQVASLLAHAGDRVMAGALLVTISPAFTNRVVAYLPERMALSARVGAPVSVTPLAAAAGEQRQYPATIVSLSANVAEQPLRNRPVPNYPVWGRGLVVSLNDKIRLIPGEVVTIAFLKRP